MKIVLTLEEVRQMVRAAVGAKVPACGGVQQTASVRFIHAEPDLPGAIQIDELYPIDRVEVDLGEVATETAKPDLGPYYSRAGGMEAAQQFWGEYERAYASNLKQQEASAGVAPDTLKRVRCLCGQLYISAPAWRNGVWCDLCPHCGSTK